MTDSSYRRPPRWTDPFLLALVRTGEVREAAKWAGVDYTTAYARRKAHPDFADAWDGALQTHKRLMEAAEAAELDAVEPDKKNEPPFDKLRTNEGLWHRDIASLG